MAITCDKNILKTLPCLGCLSEKELLALQAYAWVEAAFSENAEANIQTIQQQMACLNCFSEKQLLRAETAVLLERFDPSESVPQQVAHAKPFINLPRHFLLAIIAYSQCVYWKAHPS